jgi:hypothetical protein
VVFSKEETLLLNKIASDFLPATGDRPAVFLDNVLLAKLNQSYSTGFFTTYITDDPNMPVTKAKGSQLLLAISIGR